MQIYWDRACLSNYPQFGTIPSNILTFAILASFTIYVYYQTLDLKKN